MSGKRQWIGTPLVPRVAIFIHKYTERLAEAGIDPSVGCVGDSSDNAMAETIIVLFKTEVINFMVPWKSVGQIEWETMAWVSW